MNFVNILPTVTHLIRQDQDNGRWTPERCLILTRHCFFNNSEYTLRAPEWFLHQGRILGWLEAQAWSVGPVWGRQTYCRYALQGEALPSPPSSSPYPHRASVLVLVMPKIQCKALNFLETDSIHVEDCGGTNLHCFFKALCFVKMLFLMSLGAVKQRLSPNDLKPEGTWVLMCYAKPIW